MEFNFDSSEHIAYVSSPAAKAINAPAGIWVGFDNQQVAGWIEGKELEAGIAFEVSRRKYDESGNELKIPGVLFKQPRLLVIGRSPLLQGSERKVNGLWSRDSGCKAARRYMLIFVDATNIPLHVAPIQLTAWGHFQLNFDKQLLLFRNELETAYATAVGKRKEAKSELWHSMGVFCPQLKTEMRGSAPNESPSCITVGFNKPTPENWLSLCIGKSPIAQDIALLQQSTQGWWKKGLLQTVVTHRESESSDNGLLVKRQHSFASVATDSDDEAFENPPLPF